MRWLMFFFSVILLCGEQAWADCKLDCQNDYQSEVSSCRAQFSDPEDVDDLAECMDDAKRGFESCLEGCETDADVAIVTPLLKMATAGQCWQSVR